MLLSYLRLALRLHIRNPFYTFINVLGLSVGFAVFIVLWQYSQRELNTDKIWRDWERIVRLSFKSSSMEGEAKFGSIDIEFLRILAHSYPEFSDFVRIYNQNNFRRSFIRDHDKEVYFSLVDNSGIKKSFLEHRLVYADSNLFQFFSIPLIHGDAKQVLTESKSIVLSEKLAKKYFGNLYAVGSTLLLNDSIPFVVTGVFRDIPNNSHFEFEAVMSLQRLKRNSAGIDLSKESWSSGYYKLPADAELNSLRQKLAEAKSRFLEEHFERWNWRGDTELDLQPLHRIAFEILFGDASKVKSEFLLRTLAIVSILVLVMALINYINLSIAAHKNRMKEQAARATFGARSWQIISQFLIEALLINFVAFLVALTVIQITKTPLNSLLSFVVPEWKDLTMSTIFIVACGLIGCILFSAALPYAFIRRHTPIRLFGSLEVHRSKNQMSHLLIIVQFVIAIILVVWVFGINAQLKFITEKNIGIEKDQVIVIDLPFVQSGTFRSELAYFSNALEKQPGVIDYAISSSVAGDQDPNGVGLQLPESAIFYGVGTNGGVDERFLDFYRINIIEGRNFLPDNPADRTNIIVSKRAIERLGIYNAKDAIGRKVLVERAKWTLDMQEANIIGVIEDYSPQPLLNGFQGFWHNRAGLALTYGNKLDEENTARKISMRINMKAFDETLAEIRALYVSTFNNSLFNWYFLDDNVNRHYRNEDTSRNQLLLFTGVAISIACIGLLGMTSNKVVEKTKEIGLRKVLGASPKQIAAILLGSTMKHILVASVVGIPAAYYLVEQYLQKFSERITVEWWYYGIPIGIFIVILLATVFSVLLRAAQTNPVEALRYE